MQLNRSPPKHKTLLKGGSKISSTSIAPSSASSSSSASSPASLSTSSLSNLAAMPTISGAGLLARTSKPLQLGAGGSSGGINRTASSYSLYSNSSTSGLLGNSEKRYPLSSGSGINRITSSGSSCSNNGSNSSTSIFLSNATTVKRGGKKTQWGNRERSGMSFLIVIAFFAVFGLIILTELFMIDGRSHGGMMVLHNAGSLGNRLGDSMPDYDNIKDDYDLLDGNLFSDNKLGFVQFQDNKLKIQDADNTDGRYAGVLLNGRTNKFSSYGGGGGAVGTATGGHGGIGLGNSNNNNNLAHIPWGKMLPASVEETLPRYPIGNAPTDGSWQVVNGTRFKFFVFSAFYDRRDGGKLVRVIGATKTRGPERVWCRFWYVNRNVSANEGQHIATSATVMARVKVIRENWNLKYSACFILCPVHLSELEVPQYVSIVARLRAPPGNLLELRNTDWDSDFVTSPVLNVSSAAAKSLLNVTGGSSSSHARHKSSSLDANTASPSSSSMPIPMGDQIPDKIAICVKPFHFNYDQALYLMEYLEFYTLLGVSHFTFYNHTIGPHATCVLQHYMSGDVPDKLTAWDDGEVANTVSQRSSDIKVEDAETVSITTAKSNNNNNNGNNTNGNGASLQQPPPPLPTPTITSTKARRRKYHKSTASSSANYVKPTINILPWNLRMRSQKEIRTEGLFAALNDCLYRTMYRYKYLTLVDLDEFIVPRHNDTLNELINSLNGRFRNRNTGAYSFQNAFFYLQFPDDALATQNTPQKLNQRLRAALVTQRKTRRRFKLHPQKQRSKYICKPEAVVEAGNHFVWEFSPGKGSLNVPPADAILQHYRVCEFGGNDCIKAPSVVDRTATKYVNRLVQRVDAVYQYLRKPCELPDLPALNIVDEVVSNVANVERKRETNKMNNDHAQSVVKKEIIINPSITTMTTSTMMKTTATATATTTTTTKTTATTTTGVTTTNEIKARADRQSATGDNGYGASFRLKHKLVVFDRDGNGMQRARVEYIY